MSKYFSLAELTRSTIATHRGYPNDPNDEQIKDLRRLMDYLDRVREAFGKAIIVTSGFRSPRLNKAIGGAPDSQHMKGQAADIRPIDFKELRQLFDTIRRVGGFDQLIYEEPAGRAPWIHVSIAPTNRPPRGDVRHWDGHTYKHI
ncbi:D-Ala-D-Ala carboxypeptidase family metallohydrolase [Porphyromonas sp.]